MAAAAALLVVVFIGYCAATLPVSGGGNADEPDPAIVFTAADGQVFAARGAAKGDKVETDRLPVDLIHAVIAIEDRRFYSHHGIDLRGILRNRKGIGKKRVSLGGSRERKASGIGPSGVQFAGLQLLTGNDL